LGKSPASRAGIQRVGVSVSCCLLLVTNLHSHAYFLSRADDLLGGMWAVIATVFVLRDNDQRSLVAAVSRMAAAPVSFVLCLLYVLFLPFNPIHDRRPNGSTQRARLEENRLVSGLG
jgi:hypothetical protein